MDTQTKHPSRRERVIATAKRLLWSLDADVPRRSPETGPPSLVTRAGWTSKALSRSASARTMSAGGRGHGSRRRTPDMIWSNLDISTRKLSRAPRPPHRFSFLRSSRVSSVRSSGIQNTRSRIGPGRRPICERSLARQDEAGRLRT